MKPGTLLYKCRLCGRIDISTHTPDISSSIIAIMLKTKHPFTGIPVDEWSTHHCSDGSTGVSDLIGGCEDKLGENKT